MSNLKVSGPGNSDCVNLLEQMLELAKSGVVVQVAVSTVEIENGVAVSKACWTAPQRMVQHIAESVHRTCKQLDDFLAYSKLPPRDDSVGADHVVFNVPDSPPSFDSVVWLLTAEMARVRHRAPAPLKVHFWRGQDGESPVHPFIDKVIKPCMDMLGAVEDPTDIGAWNHTMFTTRDIASAARAGERAPVFHAPEYAQKAVAKFLCGERSTAYQRPVTITLRERDAWTKRNSNMEAWFRFADRLRSMGKNVVFLRDTAYADEPIAGETTYPEASKNTHIRMALYEAAECNLFVSNGPATLAWFSERPWLAFIPRVADDDEYWANTPRFWREMHGVEQGGQFPWARADQRLVWGEDSFEMICSAWDNLQPQLRAAA